MNTPDRHHSCQDAKTSLGDYLEGLLADDARRDLEAHLAGCRSCRLELENERRTFALLDGLERETAPAGFGDRVMAALFPAPAARRAPRPARSRLAERIAAMRPLGSHLALSAALILLLLVLAQWFRPTLMQENGPEKLRSTATLALLEGGRELSGTVQFMEKAKDRLGQISRPVATKIQSLVKMERLLRSAVPGNVFLLILLVGLTPLVLVFAVYRLRIKGAMSHVLVLPVPR